MANKEAKTESQERVPAKRRFDFKLNLFAPKISLSEQMLFAKHLSMMLQSGISEVESIRILKEQVGSRRMRVLLDKVIAYVENGQFLSEALAQLDTIFGELFINIVKLGEISGTLPENLDYLAEEIKKKADLRAKVKSALIYPLIILIATVGIAAVLVLFVLPRILPIFTSLNVTLPITTRILIGITDFMNQYYLAVAAGIAVLFVSWSLLLRLPKIKYISHRILLFIPIAGKISSDYSMSNMARTLGLLLKSGVKIVEAISATASSMTNLVYKKALTEAVEEVRQGTPLYQYLERKPKLFPPVLTRMIQIGERTGHLDGNLVYLSEFYENSLSEKVKNLSSVLEPLLMVFMGLLVGFIALSIITPIYEVTQNIHS